uniref:serine/threonine-protein kinase n=1 Tax=Verrucosispora sioxanthis TaxID=2499994 RepID=UPI00359F964F
MSEAAPQLVADRYRLLSPLGQGGMGRVWKARDEVLHRDVAIKELVPPPGLTSDERREMRERSLREARAIARLNNINVVRIFDVLRTDGDPWIVMEYVASKSLQDTIAEDGPVSPARAVEIGLGVLNALKAAHKAGIMHRDVKPGNVLLGTDGRVVLTDFGLATIPGDPNVTRTGMVLGSPAYIAPERARDGTFGPEADLWSLGATLYAAVEGKSPFARPSAISTLAALATEPVPPARNAGPLKQVLAGLLRKDPEERITAESAERMLRRAGGRRARGISLLDGVRRPGPNGPRAGAASLRRAAVHSGHPARTAYATHLRAAGRWCGSRWFHSGPCDR